MFNVAHIDSTPDLRIALIAEGSTDYPIIHAALRAFMPRPFILTWLPLESKLTPIGEGWGGVLKMCEELKALHSGSLDDHPLLAYYDMLIIHVDVDVSTKQYSDYGHTIATLARTKNWGHLPCAHQCPPVTSTVQSLSSVLDSWLLPMVRGSHTVYCLPAQSSGTWLAVATIPATQPIIQNSVECNTAVESMLAGGGGGVKKKYKIKKNTLAYNKSAPQLTNNWDYVKGICTQAQKFEYDTIGAIPP
ncbi:hypothetical protein WCU61_16860 [Pectobacterium versatile]|uniref:hypothetical protein n=1 Tax=Pectobacterium versatile TaxID=2488639 RepID=UPI003017D1D7